MSKIDLSKAKIGDKFRTRRGKIMEYIGESRFNNQYILKDERDIKLYFYKEGNYTLVTEHKYDLIEQVFGDKKDRAITDKILKDVEKAVNGVTEAIPLIESAAIANLPRDPLPENNEDDAELQRRQEVVELAEKMYIMFENETLKYRLNRDGIGNFCSENLREMAIIRAACFIDRKHKYLKDSKLC